MPCRTQAVADTRTPRPKVKQLYWFADSSSSARSPHTAPSSSDSSSKICVGLGLGRAGRHRIQPSTCGPSSNTQVPSSNRQTAMSGSTGPSHVKQGSAGIEHRVTVTRRAVDVFEVDGHDLSLGRRPADTRCSELDQRRARAVSSRIGELIRATSRRAEHDPCRLSAKVRQRPTCGVR
jgi:hypothetical protein